MRFFDFLKQPSIHHGLEEYDSLPHALLLDVRTPQEFAEGHIPCSENVPLNDIESICERRLGCDVPVFVYCHSGARSHQAARALRELGFTSVRNIGGICSYMGKLEMGSENTVCTRMRGAYCD